MEIDKYVCLIMWDFSNYFSDSFWLLDSSELEFELLIWSGLSDNSLLTNFSWRFSYLDASLLAFFSANLNSSSLKFPGFSDILFRLADIDSLTTSVSLVRISSCVSLIFRFFVKTSTDLNSIIIYLIFFCLKNFVKVNLRNCEV